MRRSLLPLFALSASWLLAPALAQDDHPPLDAVGNARISQAPYVQPADHTGRLIASDFTLSRCMVSCPAESIDVMEFRNGNEPGITHKTPGRYHAEDVTVCCDKTTMKPLLDWFAAIKSGKGGSPGRDLTLEILGTAPDGKEQVTCRFVLHRAWPHQVNWTADGMVCVQLAVESTEMAAAVTGRG
jgi:hypothetical protein